MRGFSGQLERLSLLMCCWAWGSHAVLAERTVFFADPNLKAAVVEKLGTADPNAREMLALVDLDGNSRNIADLAGIESATNLVELFLPRNRIRDISALSKLTKLTMLNLSRNRIGNVSAISMLKDLKVLDLADNLISDISVLSHLNSLETLHLHHNRIEDISALSRFTKLKELSLDDNRICDISAVAGLRNLTRFSASYNEIVDISAVSELGNLTQLYLSHNQIYDAAPLASLFGREELDLEVSYNKHNDIRFGSGLTHLSFMEVLDKNAAFLNDPRIETIRRRNPFGIAAVIASNIEEHIKYIMEKPGGFEELRRIVIEELQDYPENPRGKHYLKKGLGAYFIVHERAIGYFCDVRDYYTHVWFLRPRSQDPGWPGVGRMAVPSYPHVGVYPQMGIVSRPNADIFEVDGSLYMFTWAYMTGTGSFPMVSLWTVTDGRMAELEGPKINGYFESYDFDNRVLYTTENGERIKQERDYKGGKALYNVAYFVNDKIEKASEECANPWYLVVHGYLKAIWEKDIQEARQFVSDEAILEHTKNYRYCDANIPIEFVGDGYCENADPATETICLQYNYMDGKGRVEIDEVFDLQEFDGKWKIIDIREMSVWCCGE